MGHICIRSNMTIIMVRIFSLTVSFNFVMFAICSENSSASIDQNSTYFNSSLYPPVHGDLRFAGSSGLFFLHLIKHKLYKLQQLEKIQSTTQTSQGCICVPYYQCDVNNNIILTGMVLPIDIRYRPCTGNFEVCCFLRITPIPPTMRPTVPPTMRPTVPPTMRPTVPTFPPTIRPTFPPTIRPTPFPTVVPPNVCYCVYTFQCINGFLLPNTVIGPGLGPVINPRQAVGQFRICTLQNQICCRVFPIPNVIPSTNSPPTRRFYPSLDPRPNTFVPLSATSPSVPQTQIVYPNFSPGETCICIPTAQCNILGYIAISGSNNLNPLYGMGSLLPMGTPCINSQETCCTIIFSQPQLLSLDANYQDVKYPGTSDACRCVQSTNCAGENVIYPEGFDSGFGICPQESQVCCKITLGTEVATVGLANNLFVDNECGFPSTAFAPDEAFPIESGKTYFAEFPWMVAILLRYPEENDAFICGGSVISSRAVLTAAHCLENRSINNLVARFGEWDTNSNEEQLPYQDAEVEAVILHPEFFSAALYHDVAILILKTAVKYTINVRPICLPYQGQDFPSGTRCYATGWGRSGSGEFQNVLRKIDLPLINQEDCQNRLRQTRLGQYFILHSSFICAGGEDSRDTCRGDGGGPLVCPMASGQYVQVGIVSWGIGCGTKNPAVYSSVIEHRMWIDQQLAYYGV